jgi:DNA replication and repair protein RecF
MNLLQIDLARWRNLERVRLEPDVGLNVLHGPNGQGKTNLLEAVYYLATLRSFRSSQQREFVSWGENSYRVEAKVNRDDRIVTYEISGAAEGRSLKIDGSTLTRPEEYFGGFNVVLFTPEHLGLVRGEPALRRTFIDRACFNVFPSHLEVVRRYNRVLRARNLLLKQAAGAGLVREDLLDVLDQQLAASGVRLVRERQRCLSELGPQASETHQRLVAGRKTLELIYRTKGLKGDISESLLLHALQARREEDQRRGFTGVGPHADELMMKLAGRSARASASQGETRTIVLALKLAELTWILSRRGESPVLLLDDMGSELDEQRRALLFGAVDELQCQTFLTTVSGEAIPSGRPARHFLLEAGRVTGPVVG